ncbi:MAG: DUF4062 domain-containing protein [Paludibacteraceae bacterium]|nr:DUF4062 domain-containing protein [Paludibacteraceae bacterium]
MSQQESEAGYVGSRRIRVFLSSTFQDMQAERDYLVKNTFPAIMQIARRRNVEFSVVDLRWGVTEEEAHEGKVIEICLNQIEDTRPFFIGLIGDRYGWCPIEADIASNQRLLNAYPWVKESIASGLSMTEIEMRFGVFMAEKQIFANFYLKDGNGASDQPEAIQNKLRSLREMVEKKGEEGVCNVSHFGSPKQLGQHVYRSLVALMDELYPESQADPLHVTMDKQVYLVRQMQQIYANRSAIQMLDSWLKECKETKWCWFIGGGSGEGKTALVCNWRKDDPHIIRTLLNEELHTSAEAIAHFEAEREKRGLQPGEVIWIIDGLDYLETDEDRSLQWLKDEKLQEVNLILTSRSNEYEKIAQGIAQMKNRVFRSATPPIPAANEIREITIAYLHHFAKGLSDAQLDRIARFPLFKNILVLQYFLQELVQFGVYEELDNYIDTYLRVNNTEELISLILDRLEKDYGEKNVRTYFGMLSLTSCGIPELEMQVFTGLNTIEWAAFSSALSLYTNRANQMLTIRPAWKEIAQKRYCEDEERVNDWRKKFITLYQRLLDKARKEKEDDWFIRLIYILLRIAKFDKLVSENEKEVNIRNELLLNKIHVDGLESAFKDVSLLEILTSIRDADLFLYYREYINGSAQKFLSGTNYFGWIVIALFDLSTLYAYLVKSMLPLNEERQKVYNHIRRRLLPKSIKKTLLNSLDQYITTNTATNVPFEDKWADIDIKHIDSVEVVTFYTTELPYILSDTRIRHIEEETDKMIERIGEGGDKTDLSLFHIVKAYCLYRKGEYKNAYDTFTIATQYNDVVFKTVPLLAYFLILLKVKRYKECQDIFKTFENLSMQTDKGRAVRDALQIYYIEKLLYHYTLQEYDQAEAIIKQVVELYSKEDPNEAYDYLRNMGYVATNHQFYHLGAQLYIEARKIKSDPSPEDDYSLLDNIVSNYLKTDALEEMRPFIQELIEAEKARNNFNNEVWAETRYTETFLKEKNRYIRRSQIKQCFENYIEAMKPLLQYGPEKVSERSYYVWRVNYYSELAQGELNYHLWGPESAFIQQLADDMETIYEKAKEYGDVEWIYNLCMLAAERVDRIQNDHFTTTNSYLNHYFVLRHRKDEDFEKMMEYIETRDTNNLFSLWDKIEPIHPFEWRARNAEARIKYIYDAVWNDAMEIYRLPFLRKMAEEKNTNAIASMILYSYLTDNNEEMQYYLQMAEPFDTPPLKALRQCLKSLNRK